MGVRPHGPVSAMRFHNNVTNENILIRIDQTQQNHNL